MVEKDPDGLEANVPGAKLDHGKAPVMRGVIQYFPRALEQVAFVSEFGARRYSWGGFRHVKNGFERYSDAMGRHLLEEALGHLYDKDSGIYAAAHTAWNALARLELLCEQQEALPECSSDVHETLGHSGHTTHN